MLVSEWEKYLRQFSDENADIYFTEGYVHAQATADDEPICFLYNEENNFYLCPFLKRRVSWLSGQKFDVETPYGYGGPISNTNDNNFLTRATTCMENELREAGVIAGFFRFHPLLGNHELLRGSHCFKIISQKETIVIDLSLSEERLWWEQIHPKHRNAIRQAQRKGIIFQLDTQREYLGDFCALYNATMERVHADETCFFSRAYFDTFLNLVPDSFLAVILQENKCIAGAIFMRSRFFGHYHLSASNYDAQLSRPNNLLIYESALALKRMGIRLFHLGGAPDGSQGKSLMQFKSRFSKKSRHYYIGKAVFDEENYSEACTNWNAKYPEKYGRFQNFALKYRF